MDSMGVENIGLRCNWGIFGDLEHIEFGFSGYPQIKTHWRMLLVESLDKICIIGRSLQQNVKN